MNKKLLFLFPISLLLLSVIPNFSLHKDKVFTYMDGTTYSPTHWNILPMKDVCSDSDGLSQEEITSCACPTSNGILQSTIDARKNKKYFYGFPVAALLVDKSLPSLCGSQSPVIWYSLLWMPVDLALIGGSLALAMKANNIHLRKPK
jgi:hypothetical protein